MPNDLYIELDRTEASPPFGTAQSRPESGTLLESLRELREILRAFNTDDTDDREEAAPKGASADLIASAAAAGTPGKADPACEESDDTEAFYASPMVGLGMPSDGVTTPPDPLPAIPESPPRRRRSTAFAVVAIAGVVVLGATGLVMARGPDLHLLMTSASGKGQPQIGDRGEAAARAALPPVIPAIARSDAAPRDLSRQAPALAVAGSHRAGAAVLLPAAAIAQAAPARGGNAAATAPAQAAAPRHTSAAAPMPRAAAQTGTAPSVAMPSPADRAAGKQLREAGDARFVEGDIASARLFYERAAADGDAQAALGLGNSFNPAFLERLGVLGMRGDVVAAARWYRRAHALGDPDAAKALQNLAP